MDTAISSSIGDTYGANLQPMEQLKHCVKIFEPIKDKILCVLPGNHENRIYRSDGIDLTEMMCAQLGILPRYTNTTAMVFVRFGSDKGKNHGRPFCYSIYVTHGAGGGRREGGKINRLVDLAGIVDADVYIHHHTHLPVVLKNKFFRTESRTSTVSSVERLFVNGAAALDYGGYGDTQGFRPASKSSPVIYLCGTKKAMWAKL